MTLLSIDPGRSYKGTGRARQSIGYCLFDRKGAEILRGALSWEELADALDLEPRGRFGRGLLFLPWGGLIDEVVIEDFVNDPKSARGGQRNGTSECIGSVEIMARKAGVPFTRQRSAELGPAKLHAGYVQKLKHLPHEDSAYLHGYEYLVSTGVLQPKGLADTLKSTVTPIS